ncbi:MAG: hypothetical protein II439_07325, partial [Firmicutes bacterium]|nr:hypothetical protein [Bacillota bacterium]
RVLAAANRKRLQPFKKQDSWSSQGQKIHKKFYFFLPRSLAHFLQNILIAENRFTKALIF